MKTTISEKELPIDIALREAIEIAYPKELTEVVNKLRQGIPCLVECEKSMAGYAYINFRNRLKAAKLDCIYIDGRARQNDRNPQDKNVAQDPLSAMGGLIGTMIGQIRDAVRGGATEHRVLVLPHLDLLTSSTSGLTGESREVIALLYENPELIWLGFKDPSFPLPEVIENLFGHRVKMLGIPRDRLPYLITQKEAKKFGKTFNPFILYKYISGVNAVRLRRLLSTLEGEDYPSDLKHIYAQIRQSTLNTSLDIPEVDLDTDIGGYEKVKKQLRQEILDILSKRDQCNNEDQIRRFEDLIPRGMIFWGPPGTGKTYFAKAMATALGAAITIVSGPELKSKWVGESEENLRQVFYRARQAAPAIIVFDELDSFATSRGTYHGSGVEHSMVNQLLTEMDGFHKDELVFIIGTTNYVESLDAALLRPGRFEFHIEIPYPDEKDRLEILKIYNEKLNLKIPPKVLDYAVKRTGDPVDDGSGGFFSGDHLYALCRSLARIRLRSNRSDETTIEDIEKAFTEYDEKLVLTGKEELLLSTHEAGHFICALHCPLHPPPERITIQSERSWAPAYVRFQQDESRRLGMTKNQMMDDLCVLLGGIEAERHFLKDISTGAGGSDLYRATVLAHMIVEVYGMDDVIGLRQFRSPRDGKRMDGVSPQWQEKLDSSVSQLIRSSQERAAQILQKHESEFRALRDLLIKEKNLDIQSIKDMGIMPKSKGKNDQ